VSLVEVRPVHPVQPVQPVQHAPAPRQPERSRPSVTVVVPTKDRPLLLVRALRSVLGQEYDGDIECIVVFDQDETHEPSVPTSAGRTVRVVRNARTAGLAGSRNTGYVLATGELLAACDDDDEWLPGKLEAQVTLLLSHPEASLASTGIVIRYDGRDIPRDAQSAELSFDDFLQDRHMQVHPSTYLARRTAVVDGYGLVDEEIPGGYAEDYEWLLRASRTGNVVCVQQRLVRVHWHAASFFTSRWDMIDEALTWLIEREPAFARSSRGLGRIEGQLAFANAARGRRRVALRWFGSAVRHHPTSRQAWAALPVAARLVSADRVVAAGRRLGRGV
jgi:glycosyltransferase involved in cell wall biosynthesis